MIISSEKKFKPCSKCNGSGRISEPSIFPWMADNTTSCSTCHGSGKKETDKYDYDKNTFNINNIVTIGEIEFDEDYGMASSWVTAKFYINGHIKISEYEDVGMCDPYDRICMKCKKGQSPNDHPDYKPEMKKLTIAVEEAKKKAYLKIKKVRDDIIGKLKNKRG